jgi:hypothetical protein
LVFALDEVQVIGCAGDDLPWHIGISNN